LLERETFLTDLLAAHAAAARGGRIALVYGEAGIGKTTLAQAFAARVPAGSRVLWGGCDPLSTPTPLGPIRDIARQAGGALARLLESAAPRERLFASFHDELRRRGTAIVVEDVHWADEATLDLLKFTARRVERTLGLLIVTFREDELGADHALRAFLGDLPRAATLRLALPPLSESAVVALARQAGRSPDGLYAATDGNPFFVAEALASHGTGVPASIRDAALARVARLSAAARAVLELVSIVPGRVERELVDDVVHAAPGAVDECVAGGVLRAEQGALAFRHELVRLAVSEAMPPGRARALHQDVLRVLVGQPTAVTGDAHRLAHHAAHGCDGAAVLVYGPVAATQAAAVGAHRQAAQHYEAALRYAESLPAGDRAALYEGHSVECYLTDQLEAAIAARRAAFDIWTGMGDGPRAGACLRWLSHLHWFSGDRAEAERYGREAILALTAFEHGPELAMAYSNQSQLHILAGNAADAIAWGGRAIELAERLGHKESLTHALNNVGSARYLAGDQAAGKDALERALAIALRGEMHEHAARAYAGLAASAVSLRDYATATEVLERGLGYCGERDLDSWTFYMLGCRARARFEQGDWSGATADAQRVLSNPLVAPVSRIAALVVLGRVRGRRGDPQAQAALDEARALARRTREVQRIVPVAAARAEAAWLRGALSEAADELAAAYELAQGRVSPWEKGELAFWLCRATVLPGPPAGVAAPYALQLSGDWRGAAAAWHAAGCPYEAALALAEGDPAEGLQQLEALGAAATIAALRNELLSRGVRGVPRGPRAATRANPAGLTGRQLDVLRLLVQGMRNADIAQRLGLSPRTADHHVSAVLAKLGVRTRGEAAAAARTLGLELN
jgi:DNA-binding CsgD family transcriptional regulator/tRNA A37 threonylcarbamoyladenosine biosynthesis protein TsaE